MEYTIKHSEDFEQAVSRGIEAARYAGETRGVDVPFDPMAMYAGKAAGMLYEVEVDTNLSYYVTITGIGREMPSGTEGEVIIREDTPREPMNVRFMGAIDYANYSGIDPSGERVEYRLEERRELVKI